MWLLAVFVGFVLLLMFCHDEDYHQYWEDLEDE